MMTVPTSKYIASIWGTSKNDVFAVGGEGTIIHYDGNSWSLMESGTTNELSGIWGSSHSDVFAVGVGGVILHYNGNNWSTMSSGTTKHIESVWGSSSSDVFAVGEDQIILHYNGNNWSITNTGYLTVYLSDVWGTSGTDVYAVGDGRTILHYDGSNWSPASFSCPNYITYFSGVWGSSSSNVFVAGGGGVLHYDGFSWSLMDLPETDHLYSLVNIWGSSENDIWVTGTTLFHYTPCVRLSLLKGLSYNPSNVYLFFSVETDDGSGNPGEPITGLTENDFEIYEDNNLISKYESNLTVIPSPSVSMMSTALLLDMSGSILEAATLDELKTSAKLFVSQIAGVNGQEVAIYLFDGREQIRQLIPFTKNITDLQSAIQSLTKEQIISDPGYDISTNLNGAIQQGLAILDSKSSTVSNGQLFTGTLVTFTDGTDQAGRVSNSAAVASVNASSHSSFTVGLGAEIDEAHLTALGKDGFVWAKNISELEFAFTKIADDIKKDAQKVYILGYCTPKRAGSHNVTIKIPGYSGSLSYSFNADGFAGGCNPLDIIPTTTTTTVSGGTTTTTSIPGGTTTTTVSGTTTTTTVPKNRCLARSIYGDNAEETQLLRRYRDTTLNKTEIGRQMIKAYYMLSPAVTELLQNSEVARTNGRRVIDKFLLALRENLNHLKQY